MWKTEYLTPSDISILTLFAITPKFGCSFHLIENPNLRPTYFGRRTFCGDLKLFIFYFLH